MGILIGPHMRVVCIIDTVAMELRFVSKQDVTMQLATAINPYPTAFPYGNVTVLHFYQQQESSTTETVNKVINKGRKTYV